MNAAPPAPLVPSNVDLRGLQYMPLFGERLFGSETWIAASADGKVAALRLWWRSYAHEVPAASLPDNDQLLAEYAGYGVAVKAWKRIRAQAMRGWLLCSDGRLYHPVVAQIALESWESRKRNREKQARLRARNRERDQHVTGPVTVTQGVTERVRNAGDGQGGDGSRVMSPARGAHNPTDEPEAARRFAPRAAASPNGPPRAGAPREPLSLTGPNGIWKVRLSSHRPGGDWPADHGPPPESDQDNPLLNDDQRRQWRRYHGLASDWRSAA
jgi:hypothetical protein